MAASQTYFQLEGQRKLGSDPAGSPDSEPEHVHIEVWDYLRHVQRRLSEEGERCDVVIGQDVKGGILRVVESTLVGSHTVVLLSRGKLRTSSGSQNQFSMLSQRRSRVDARPRALR